jgi:hypothetical protein
MKTTKKLAPLFVASGLVALLAAFVAAPATATRTVKVTSSISISSKNLKFSGKVTAPGYEPCVQQRKVLLYKVVSGGPDQAVGETRTSLKGNWTIEPQGSAGISLARFYAKVGKVSEGTAGTIYVCKAARSKTVGANPARVSSGPEPGEEVTVKTTTTINPYGSGGKVSAAYAACREDRTVVIKQQGKGKIGSAKTNAKGAWSAEPAYKGSPPLKVWAEVKPITQATAGPIYKCLAATSRTVTINGG